MYNPDWEKDVRYTSWIRPGASCRFAFCRLCEEQIPAEAAALRGHLSTLKHMKSVEYDDQLQRISALGSESISLESAVNDESVLIHEISHCEEDDSATVQHTFERLSSALVMVKDDRHEPLERLSFIIGKFLLKGEKMLKDVCAKCECVLLEDNKKQPHCVGCQYGLMDELNAANAEKIKGRRTVEAEPQLGSTASMPVHDSSAVVFKEETVDDVAEIYISEVDNSSPCIQDSPNSASFGDGLLHDADAAALRSEVQSLVVTLQSRLSVLTHQLNAACDVDDCLECLDRTVTALAKLKNLDDIS
ncbi:Sjoegren syndrome/scleroderma autoantigen 1 [Trinorchestia longiramus]|nr:Sjoegren syndrome/scleroderma autoantigen 1 [Trinorchestia longiramus]